MRIEHVLAVVSVSDIEAARAWYERFFGRPADNRPMENLVEWRATETGWLQVFSGGGLPGTGTANFAVDDIERTHDELSERELSPGPIVDANKGVRLVTLSDPDGNTINLIGGFRISY